KSITWWGVLCWGNAKAKILHSSAYIDALCANAIQSGPRLLINKQTPALKEDLSRKSAVGIDANQNLILIITEEAIPMSEFSKLLRLPESQGGFALTNVLNFFFKQKTAYEITR